MSSLNSTFDDFWVDEDGEFDHADVIPLPDAEVAPQAPASLRSRLAWIVFPVWGLLIVVTMVVVGWQMLGVDSVRQENLAVNADTLVRQAIETTSIAPVVAAATDTTASQLLSTASFWLLVEPRFLALRTTRELPRRAQARTAAVTTLDWAIMDQGPPVLAVGQPTRIAPTPVEPSGVASARPDADEVITSALPAAPQVTNVGMDSFKRISVAEQENRLLERVRIRLFEGNQSRAIDELQTFIDTHGTQDRTLAVLAGLLVQSGRFDAANRQLSAVTSMSDPELRFLKARVLVQFNDVSGALALLQPNLPRAEDNLAYHALLAALYRRAGQYGEAVSVYRTLVEILPDNGDWLLGLAISQDQLGAADEAALAFEQMLVLRTLTPEVRAYAQSRLLAIGNWSP